MLRASWILASVFSVVLVVVAIAQVPRPQQQEARALAAVNEAKGKTEEDRQSELELAADLEQMQGSWQLLHGNTRSLKTIKGNIETLRRYDRGTNEQKSQHQVEFRLSKSGSVRLCTFFAVGGDPKKGLSFVYRVNDKSYWDVPGLLQGTAHRNYSATPQVWRWTRIDDDSPEAILLNEAGDFEFE